MSEGGHTIQGKHNLSGPLTCETAYCPPTLAPVYALKVLLEAIAVGIMGDIVHSDMGMNMDL